MTFTSKLLGAVSFAALSVLGATTASAAGTLAGSTITNTVSVNFNVGGVAQTASSASNVITVDRKVNFTVVNTGSTTAVSPGQTGAVTTWQVTNSSNDTLSFGLAATNQTTGATAQHGGTDAFDVASFTYYADTAGTGVYAAGDAVITSLNDVAPDATKTIFVLANVPSSATNTQVAGVVLTATGQGSAASSTGTTANQTLVNGTKQGTSFTVFADGVGTGGTDVANDDKMSAKGDYTVSAAQLTVQKLSTIISDPINGTTSPKAIPGAVVEYCIVVANAAGAATATNLAIGDPLPSQTSYVASFNVLQNGTFNNGTSTCNADGAAGGTYSAAPTPTVSGTLNNLAAGATETLRFRVTIN